MKKFTIRKRRVDGINQRYHLKRKGGVKIDYSKVRYGSRDWENLTSFQEENKGNIIFWKSATGDPFEVKRGRLYYKGEPVYKWHGWGISKGVTNYEYGRSKYKRYISNGRFIEEYLRKYMKPFTVPLIKR